MTTVRWCIQVMGQINLSTSWTIAREQTLAQNCLGYVWAILPQLLIRQAPVYYSALSHTLPVLLVEYFMRSLGRIL